MLISTPKASIWKKANPFWWVGNQYNPVESEPQFLPKYPLWIRRLIWALRNPGENFNRMVIGFWDQGARAVCPFGGNPNGDWRDDHGRWNFMLVTPATQLGAGWLWFPFISYRGAFEAYAGWDHGGKFGFALRSANATAY